MAVCQNNKHKNLNLRNLCLLYLLFSYYKKNIVVLFQAALDVVDDELCGALDTQQA
jgi:hypothetical protein